MVFITIKNDIKNVDSNFKDIYGDGTKVSAGIPLFVFNYLDYTLWDKYACELRGKGTKKESPETCRAVFII